MNPFNGSMSRRDALRSAACGFGGLAFAGLANAAPLGVNSLAPKSVPLVPKAKRVIFIFMQGGPSQVDSFDPKPILTEKHEQKVEFFNARKRQRQQETLMKPFWDFKQYGESGRWVSELFPEIAQHVDELCFLQGMHTEGVAHGPATIFLHTGALALIRPSIGSWVMYGLGSESENLPGFVTIGPPPTKGGPRNYGNAFLPAIYQGTALGRAGASAKDARFKHVINKHQDPAEQRRQFEFMQALNREQMQAYPGHTELEATIESYELAYRMQMNAPEVTDLKGESPATLSMYGIGEKATNEFGTQCLVARRLAEAGCRYIQVNYSDNGATPRWDQHSNMPKHADHAKATDKPVAGLLKDLKSRGLLEDTLVWWGGEFGRTPFSQNKNGRDHNPLGFTVWLAGGGVKPGYAHGATDEFGYQAVDGKTHMHDLHATVLHLLGLNHEELTYRYAGRDFRLTDVYGRVIDEIIA